MCCLKRGVLIDNCTDIGRIENVHIHNVYWWRVTAPYTPTGEENSMLEKYTLTNLVGYIIGRTDWEYISNCFVIWANIGFHFIKTKHGQANAVITQSGSDLGPMAVKVDSVQPHAGIAFENCQFMSGIEIGPDNLGPVKLTNCGFWKIPDTGSQVILNGNCTLILSAVHFNDWDRAKPCIDVSAGTVLVNATEFMPDKDVTTHVRLGKNASSASIMGCHFCNGKMKIVDETVNADVQITGCTVNKNK
jgi:hypothetical protein